jgi:hypothetical protein
MDKERFITLKICLRNLKISVTIYPIIIYLEKDKKRKNTFSGQIVGFIDVTATVHIVNSLFESFKILLAELNHRIYLIIIIIIIIISYSFEQ